MKNKEQAIQRLDALQAEAAKLREIIEQPEPQREPEAGDVWESNASGNTILFDENGTYTYMSGLGMAGCACDPRYPCSFTAHNPRFTYLGKFSEVYVKREGTVAISDVIEALSHEDSDGDSILGQASEGKTVSLYKDTGIRVYEALAKLGITAK
jgi:hypothetical protein